MITEKLSNKDKITIPKVVRKYLGVKEHQGIALKMVRGDIVLCNPKNVDSHPAKPRKFWKTLSQNTKKDVSNVPNYVWGKGVEDKQRSKFAKRFAKQYKQLSPEMKMKCSMAEAIGMDEMAKALLK